jgi:predicted PurR-regulated permease PerM
MQQKLQNWWDALSPLGKALVIGLAIPVIVLNALAVSAVSGYFQSLIVVLVSASLVAFLLNYPVAWAEQRGVERTQAAIVVFLVTLSVLFALGITLFPIVLKQAEQLVARLPEWIESGRQQLFSLNGRFEDAGIPLSLDTLAAQVIDPIKTQLQRLTGQVFDVAVFTVTRLLDLLLTLVLSFYLLQHGDHVWESVIAWLPVRVRQPFSKTLSLSFQNFFLGQLILASSLGSLLTLVFVWLRVPFGLLFGLTIGTMALVPFGGTVGIIVVTLLTGLRDISLGFKVLGAAVLVQQILENLVAPRVLGSVTGLNPFWVFVSILTGARVAGLLGVIVAVPTAVVIKTAIAAFRGNVDGRFLDGGKDLEGPGAADGPSANASLKAVVERLNEAEA